MNSPESNDVTGILARAIDLPHGDEHFELCREAVRMADRCGDEHLRFVARLWLIAAAGQVGYPEIQLTQAAWCIGTYERDPEKFESSTLVHVKDGGARIFSAGLGIHWALKGVLGALPDFPEISREQIEQTFAQVAGLYDRRGLNQHALHYYRAIVAREMGDEELCRAEVLNWRTTPRDESSDCAACERRHEMKFLLWEGRDEDAIDLAAPLIDGTVRCDAAERAMVPSLLHPLLRLGRVQEAAGIHLTGLPVALQTPRECLAHLAQHIGFLTVTGNYEWAAELAWRNLPHALARKDALPRLDFFLGVRAFLRARLDRAGGTRFRGELPVAVPVEKGGDGYSASELISWLTGQIDEMCAAFDRRNGNDRMSRFNEEWCAWFGEIFHPRPIRRT